MQIGKENELKYPEESQIILKDFYVADLITGSNDVNRFKSLKVNIQKILASAGFNLRKFNSSVPELSDLNVSLDNPDETYKPLEIIGILNAILLNIHLRKLI